jgi:acyl carrier protein
MKIESFCELLKQELKEETAITPETNFKELETYGSLSAVLVMKLVEDTFNTEINPRSFRNINTVNDIADAIGRDKFN